MDHGEREMKEFNNFIHNMEVEDVPLLGRKFIWFRLKTHNVLDRNLSDHCLILLKVNQLDWGPKPFRTLDYWFKDRGYVEENWKNVTVHGR